jgi:pyridoxamine 5'-phosphate oxidase
MVLSTADAQGKPHSRVVLLKEVDDDGRFCFFTSYHSAKAAELAAQPYAALNFFWPQLSRQIRLEGRVEHTSSEYSDAYFKTRPTGSQLGAHASAQSTVLPSRNLLDEKLQQLQRDYADREIPRPPHWGGYWFTPEYFEFWQGRENRLHDRIAYRLAAGSWNRYRLAP